MCQMEMRIYVFVIEGEARAVQQPSIPPSRVHGLVFLFPDLPETTDKWATILPDPRPQTPNLETRLLGERHAGAVVGFLLGFT